MNDSKSRVVTTLLQKAKQLYKADHLTEAEKQYKSILQHESTHGEANYMLGVISFKTGKNEKAVQLIKKAIKFEPNVYHYYMTIGVILDSIGKYGDAIRYYQRVLELKPDDAITYSCLGETNRKLGNLDNALTYYKKSIELVSNNPETYRGMGSVLYEMEKLDDARSCFMKALDLKPSFPEAFVSLGMLQRSTGDRDGARESFMQATASDSKCITAHSYLTELITTKEEDERFNVLERLKTEGQLSSEQTLLLYFTLGKMYSDTGQYDKAFENYSQGNNLRKALKGQHFSISDFECEVDTYLRIFNTDFFKQRISLGIQSNLPIFVVGMPRSGTTLLERIISSHPKAFGAGELMDINKIKVKVIGECGIDALSDVVMALRDETIKAAARQYLKIIYQLSDNAIRIVDKMPHNFQHLWFIALMFPRARVIHSLRNPLDTCLSCYFTDFAYGHGYRNDLRTLGLYYRQYRRLMEHWQKVLPISFLDVRYEELVENQELVSRSIINFCGLDWNERCLEFHRSRHSIKTASNVQTRKKMYRTSIGRWENYEKHLAPLKEALGPEFIV